MDIKDIMIGNLLAKDSFVVDIRYNPTDEGDVLLQTPDGFIWEDSRYLFGLEIYKNTLEELGFIWEYSCDTATIKFYTKDNFSIQCYEYGYDGLSISYKGIEIKYMHQLQNLYRMETGKDLIRMPQEVRNDRITNILN